MLICAEYVLLTYVPILHITDYDYVGIQEQSGRLLICLLFMY